MTQTLYIGDTHGNYNAYMGILDRYVGMNTVQVGDFGIGFPGREDLDEKVAKWMEESAGTHRFIRGNHDNPNACRGHPNWISDGTVKNDTMYIGGAWSIDHAWRTPGLDWWEDEECSYEDLLMILGMYQVAKPRVMITHDAPKSITEKHFVSSGKALSNIQIQTRTQNALQAMYEFHQPELWIFGHWHSHLDVVENGTRFICLAENQTCIVDDENLEVTYGELK